MAKEKAGTGEPLGIEETRAGMFHVAVRTTYDRTLLRESVESRITSLKKLAQKCRDEHRPKQAGEFEMEADRLHEEFGVLLAESDELALGVQTPLDGVKLLIDKALSKVIKDRELVRNACDRAGPELLEAVRIGIMLGYETGQASASAHVDKLLYRAVERAGAACFGE
jgi:hypothetical protein